MNGKWFSYTNRNGEQTIVNVDHIRWIGKVSVNRYGFIIPGTMEETLSREDYSRILRFIGIEQTSIPTSESPL